MDYLQYKRGVVGVYDKELIKVLNLVINGLPSIHIAGIEPEIRTTAIGVLNLVINGLPSIPKFPLLLNLPYLEF